MLSSVLIFKFVLCSLHRSNQSKPDKDASLKDASCLYFNDFYFLFFILQLKSKIYKRNRDDHAYPWRALTSQDLLLSNSHCTSPCLLPSNLHLFFKSLINHLIGHNTYFGIHSSSFASSFRLLNIFGYLQLNCALKIRLKQIYFIII